MNETLLSGEDNTPAFDPNKDYFQELVGDDKKFKSPQELAKGKYQSDLYIKTLERRLDESREDQLRLREENMTKAKLQELLDRFEAKQLTSSDTLNANEVPGKPPVDPTEIETLIESKIQARELNRKQDDNFNVVRNRLKERFGDNYQNVLKQQIDDLGLSNEDVDVLARKSPSAFFKVMGLDMQRSDSFQAPPQSSSRPDQFSPRTVKRTWAYYQNMKKQDPTLYWNPKTTAQMHKDAIELGSDFEDGDFHKR